jgi:hypothetical protein
MSSGVIACLSADRQPEYVHYNRSQKTIDIFNSYDILHIKINISNSSPFNFKKGWGLPNGQNSNLK